MNFLIFIVHGFNLCRDTYVKAMAGESPNDRNDRGKHVHLVYFDS